MQAGPSKSDWTRTATDEHEQARTPGLGGPCGSVQTRASARAVESFDSARVF